MSLTRVRIHLGSQRKKSKSLELRKHGREMRRVGHTDCDGKGALYCVESINEAMSLNEAIGSMSVSN